MNFDLLIRTIAYIFLFRWVEILFNPRSPVEKLVADVMRFVHPYLAFVTYRFHVEKARDAGM